MRHGAHPSKISCATSNAKIVLLKLLKRISILYLFYSIKKLKQINNEREQRGRETKNTEKEETKSIKIRNKYESGLYNYSMKIIQSNVNILLAVKPKLTPNYIFREEISSRKVEGRRQAKTTRGGGSSSIKNGHLHSQELSSTRIREMMTVDNCRITTTSLPATIVNKVFGKIYSGRNEYNCNCMMTSAHGKKTRLSITSSYLTRYMWIYQANRLDCLSTDWLKQGKITAVRNKVKHFLVNPVHTVLNVVGRGLVTGWTQLGPP